MTAEDILKQLVSFNTINDLDNGKIINWIGSYLSNLGFNNKIVINNQTKKKCLISSIGKDYAFGFLGHTDTVDICDGWQTNPFELTNINNNLYGLGSCDMKGGIAAILKAVSNIKKFDKGLKLYFTYDEEIGFNGILDLIKEEVFPKYMLIGEPTDLKPVLATKGLLEYKITFNGIAVHSSDPDKGVSAINNAICFINEMNLFYKKLKGMLFNKYEIPYTTMNIGMIEGGSAINKVADKCSIYIDFRVCDIKQMSLITKKVDELLNKCDCQYEILNKINPFANEDQCIVSLLEKITKREVINASYITEASFIDGNNKIILGPGPIKAHEKNEYITLESLEQTVNTYENIINCLCNDDSI